MNTPENCPKHVQDGRRRRKQPLPGFAMGPPQRRNPLRDLPIPKKAKALWLSLVYTA
ncbi:MAG: hypothetical protein VB099_05345 [Candidatus Limiplasma sp.]|nr:hypothetical protein [Candidatus Limiplasma sp.]